MATSSTAVAASTPLIEGCVGAQALDPASPEACRLQSTYAELVPVKGLATATGPIARGRYCRAAAAVSGVPSCVYGVSSSARLRVALVGDSHAEQWVPAVDAIAKAQGWRVETFLKGGCPFSTVMRSDQAKSARNSCKTWNGKVVKKLKAGDYDIILTTHASGRSFATAKGESTRQAETRGVRSQWAAVQRGSSARIIAIRDNPLLTIEPYACLNNLRNSVFARSNQCSSARSVSLRFDAESTAAKQTGRAAVDLSDYFCDEAKCYAMIGAVRVFRDGSHLSALYVRTMAPYFQRQLIPAVMRPGYPISDNTVSSSAPMYGASDLE